MGCSSSVSILHNTTGKADVSAIETFDFEFDLDNVTLLYDYGNGQYLYPENGTWNYDHLKSGFKYLDPKLDKKSKARISKIDDIITMRNLNLEQKKEMEDTSLWDTNYKSRGKILPVRVLPVYNPGDTVSGHLILEVSQKVDAKQIKILCSGVTYFYIDADEFKIDHIREETQLWLKSTNITSNNNPEKCDDNDTNVGTNGNDELKTEDNNTEGLAGEDNTPSSSQYVPVGRHRFPFKFKLPDSCPASVPNIASGAFTYICISYRLKALIERGTLFGIGNVVQYRGLWVNNEVDIEKKYPDELQPQITEKKFHSAFTDAETTVKTKTQRNAFRRGEDVDIEMELDNTAGDSDVVAIEGRLSLQGKLYSTNYMEEEIDLKGKVIKVAFTVAEGDKGKCTLVIPFDFSSCDMDNHLMPFAPGGIEKNDFVVDEPLYYINLKIVRKGFQNENFEMKFSIKVGTLDGRQQLVEEDINKNVLVPDENTLYK